LLTHESAAALPTRARAKMVLLRVSFILIRCRVGYNSINEVEERKKACFFFDEDEPATDGIELDTSGFLY
jgi:hypothetical protein